MILWFVGGLGLLVATSWIVVAMEARNLRRRMKAQQLVNGAQNKLRMGRSAMHVGAELRFRAAQLNCYDEAVELWRTIEAEMESR